MTSQIKLSKRLQIIADNIKEHARFVDIGTDHAYLPCYICLQDSSVFSVAGEVQKGPLMNAKLTVEKYGLSNQISVRLGNGLSVIEAEDMLDTIVVAGMGGKLISSILQADQAKLSKIDRLIIQPNTNEQEIRSFFLEHDYCLEKEKIVEENGIMYEVLIANKHAKNVYQSHIELEKQVMFGPILLQNKPQLFIKKWQQEYDHLKGILVQMKMAKQPNEERIKSLEKQISWIKEVIT